MGIATHLGPWLLGTTRYTTGTTAADTRNTGATIVSQDKAVAFNDADAATAFCLPAGSRIVGLQFITTDAFDAATTITLSLAGTAITGATTVTDAGLVDFAPVASDAVATLWANTGATDKLLTYTVSQGASTNGAGVLVVNYVVRNSDGTMYQTSSQV
jgi:hypothetical protein